MMRARVARVVCAVAVLLVVATASRAQITNTSPSGQIAVGTQTADAQAVATSATWSNAGVVFTHWTLDVTDTASASSSMLINARVGGVSKFSLTKTGTLTLAGHMIVASGGQIGWGSKGGFTSPSNGNVLLSDSSGAAFTCFALGGTTSSYPCLKRVGNAFAFRQGDDTVSAFAALTACASGLEGAVAAVSDSSTAVWGATVTGGGANHVLAYCNGTNWTVAAK